MRRPRLPPQGSRCSQLCRAPAVRLTILDRSLECEEMGAIGHGVWLARGRLMVAWPMSPIPNSGPNSLLRSTELGWG